MLGWDLGKRIMEKLRNVKWRNKKNRDLSFKTQSPLQIPEIEKKHVNMIWQKAVAFPCFGF